MDKHLQELYEERATLVELESDISDMRKHLAEGGILWRLTGWLDKLTKSARAGLQDEINSKQKETE